MIVIQKHLEVSSNIAVNNNNAIVDFTDNNLTDSFNFKVKMIGPTGNDGTKNVEIMVPKNI